MKAVVTGGAGLIGSHLVDLLVGGRPPRHGDRQSELGANREHR